MKKSTKMFKSLKGQRLGQAIWNAIYKDSGLCTEKAFDRLFYIEDEELIKLIKEYITN